VGLREVKKERTRQVIAETAMGLFVSRGFDRVTVAEIAEAAGVSEKTVFNYFPTKEDLFFDEVDERRAAFVAAIEERQPGESILDSLRRLQVADCARFCTPGFAAFARIIEESPALRAKELEIMAGFTRVLTDALHRELKLGDLDARIAASLLVGVHWQFFVAARQLALEGRHGAAANRRLRSDLSRSYHLLEHGLAGLEAPRNGA
jgi:AcrR family transcriptional regulator